MIFPSSKGNYRDRSSLNTSFKRILKGTDYEFLTLHQLRHCNATLLLNNGVDLKVVSEHLGHCDIGVTANIYADVLKSTKSKVATIDTGLKIEICGLQPGPDFDPKDFDIGSSLDYKNDPSYIRGSKYQVTISQTN